MIFLTVGTQLPFDRLVATVDAYCAAHPGEEVFGQIGDGRYQPENFAAVPFLSATQCRSQFRRAELVIAHVGIGSIFTALEFAKPIVMMARLAQHSEHRDNHQEQTLRYFSRLQHCYPINDADQLADALVQARQHPEQRETVSRFAPETTLNALRKVLA
ncbi:glycosyltransferase [Parahaliea aestuarii]|uniref:Glucuronosyltransferase n=1 Tax=Parahaliea aestuarii TaxID=1852021 RepID=A0A5C8ZPV4_9GAMM|nr:glycosyltransferase [Parahaliea aestuarii]TXS90468.1 glucuronosyltransferase [Parahaliea aestuarii]